MMLCFVPNDFETVVQELTNAPVELKSGREAVRILAIGSRQAVSYAIVRAHNTGFAEAGQWSKMMPTGKPNEFISVATLYLPLS